MSPQRIRDWNRERRIRRLSAKVIKAYLAGDKDAARSFDTARTRQICLRSRQQVERMEALWPTRSTRAIKRLVMRSFFRRHLPAPIVTALFRVLRLGGA